MVCTDLLLARALFRLIWRDLLHLKPHITPLIIDLFIGGLVRYLFGAMAMEAAGPAVNPHWYDRQTAFYPIHRRCRSARAIAEGPQLRCPTRSWHGGDEEPATSISRYGARAGPAFCETKPSD